jgi:flavin-dependent dehydrogenase
MCRRIEGVRLVNPDFGLDEVMALGGTPAAGVGGVISRMTLDLEILEHARRAGVEVRTRTTACDIVACPEGGVTVRLDGPDGEGELTARFAVLAEGAVGRLARKLVRPKAPPAATFALRQYFATTQDPGSRFEVYAPLICEREALAGYVWMFPVSSRLVNVGVGFTRTGPDRANLRRAFDEGVAMLRAQGRPLGAAQGAPIGAPIPTHIDPAASAGPGWLVVGDAAGVANPFTGEGIAQALETGELAAGAVHAALEQGAATAVDYPLALSRRFHRQIRLGASAVETLGVVRTYGWSDLAATTSAARGLRTGRLIVDVVLDRESGDARATWVGLTRNLGAPTLMAAAESSRRALDRLARVSPLVAQAADELGHGSAAIGRYAALLMLAAAGDNLDERALALSEVVLLATLQAYFHSDIPAAAAGAASAVAAFNILAGDAAIAMLFDVLSELDAASARALSAVVETQGAHLAASAYSTANVGALPAPPVKCLGLATSLATPFTRGCSSSGQWATALVECADRLFRAETLAAPFTRADREFAAGRLNDARTTLAGMPGLLSASSMRLMARNAGDVLRSRFDTPASAEVVPGVVLS